MFWTAIICGFGGALGGGIGLIMFMLLWYLVKSKTPSAMMDIHERSLTQLHIRNQLTKETHQLLERIAHAMEHHP